MNQNIKLNFVLNCYDAVSTDIMHRLGKEPKRIILSYYNSIAFHLLLRNYADEAMVGVLEILLVEVGNIIVPVLDCIPIKVIWEILGQVDWIVRSKHEIESALDLVDKEILIRHVGVDANICMKARKI